LRDIDLDGFVIQRCDIGINLRCGDPAVFEGWLVGLYGGEGNRQLRQVSSAAQASVRRH